MTVEPAAAERPPFHAAAYDVFPAAAPTPLLIDSPHSGCVYPPDFHTAVPHRVLRGAEDWRVDALFAGAPAAGADLLVARFPRAYIDPNRRLDDIDPALLDGPWPEPLNPGPKTGLGIGLVRAKTGDGQPLLDGPLSVADVQSRIERCWTPYRQTLQEQLNAKLRRHGAVWHLNVHSMKSVGTAITPDGPGAERPDMVLGDLDGRSCDPAFTAFVAERLRGLGYSVAVNDPYKGAEILRCHGDPATGRHSLQIEIKRALYMDETTITATEGFAPLRNSLERLVADLVAWTHRANAR